jgi:hypothetical protein
MISSPTSSRCFACFRIVFGIYLTIHFGMLIPWSAELFSSTGVLSEARLNPLHGLFPNPLVWWDSSRLAYAWTIGLTLLSLGFTVGLARRTISLLLWFGATALFHRNNLTANPSLAYIGLMLALCALIPPGEKLRGAPPPHWQLPQMVLVCAWTLLAVGYLFSGITKLGSPSWIDGTAIARLLENPLARHSPLRGLTLALPDFMLKSFTWGSLVAELAFLPCCLHPCTRKWAWFAMVGLHLGILLLIDFADLTCGMLMIHLFTFDPRWLPAKLTSAKSIAHEINPALT